MAVLFSGVDPQWQFGRGSSKKHFCEILLKSAYWPWSRCCSTFLFFALVEQNHFSKTGRGSSKEHSGEIILKLAHWPKRRCCLKGFSIFSSDGHFVQRCGTILAILVEVIRRTFLLNYVEISLLALEEMSFYGFLYF